MTDDQFIKLRDKLNELLSAVNRLEKVMSRNEDLRGKTRKSHQSSFIIAANSTEVRAGVGILEDQKELSN